MNNIESFTHNLKNNTKQINTLLEQTNKTMASLAATSEDVQKLSSETRADVKATIEKTRDAMEQLTGFLEKSNNFAGTGYKELNAVMIEMKKTLRELDQLGNSIKEDPQQLLFSPQYKGYKVP